MKLDWNLQRGRDVLDWHFLGSGGSGRPKHLKKYMKLNWNLQRGSDVLDWHFLGSGGSGRPKHLKKYMKLNLNLQRGRDVLDPFCREGMDIFWNYTSWLLNFKILNLTEKLTNFHCGLYDQLQRYLSVQIIKHSSLSITKLQTINQTIMSFSTHSGENHMAMNMIING